MKKYFALSLFLLAGLSSQAQDSLKTDSMQLMVTQTGPIIHFTAGDTLTDFNKLNGGIVKYQVSAESQAVLDSNGLVLSNPGIVTVKDPNKLRLPFVVEIKTFANDNEWYINTLQVSANSNQTPTVYVSAAKIEMATGFRKDGKIYVVITVVGILFAIVLIYLFYLGRKTAALQKKIGA